MRFVGEFVILLIVFLVMMLIGDYAFANYIPGSIITEFPAITTLGIWPGFVFALAIGYFFFRRALLRLALYLVGVSAIIIILKVYKIQGPLGITNDLMNQSPLLQRIQAFIS